MQHLDTIVWDSPLASPRSRSYAAPLVSFRSDVMSFNSRFIEAAGLIGDNDTLRFQYVDVTTSSINHVVGLRFHNELRRGARKILCTQRPLKNGRDKRPDADKAFALVGLRVKLASLYTAVPWLAAVARESHGVNGAPTSAQFTPVFHNRKGMWVVHVQPTLGGFVSLADYRSRLQQVDPFGVYAFYNSDNALIYVGEGRIASRLRDHISSGRFAIAKVRYCETDSKEQAKAMEDRILQTCDALYGNGVFENIKKT